MRTYGGYNPLCNVDSLELISDLLAAFVDRCLLLLPRIRTEAMTAFRSDLTSADENARQVRFATRFGFPQTRR
ncbi:hypothetical protein TIFTF001_014211 [Ficus carica]|uniref:Uncharacterized protein n=1 Tax=Ficus carica TaxID=3494 RepID=A0AA88A3C4_FICCA|nr:hypothetical protein TIFTF001_014211 [Ficus carica]